MKHNAITAVLLSVLFGSSAFADTQRPNILFIGVDDLRPELNCYGATHIISPNIDRLATEGVLFERAYCQWAVCMPSRASLLSGLRPDSFNGKANSFRKIVPDVVTMPQHFKNNGYFAQSFGKIYHGSWNTAYVGSSFQDPVSWSEPRWAASPRYYFSEEGVRVARQVFAEAKDGFLSKIKKNPDDPDQWTHHFVRGLATEAPDISDDLPGDGQVAVAALKKLREIHAKKQPFFLAVGFMKPHLPFIAPKKYWDLYDPEKILPVPVPARPEGAPEFAVKVSATEVNQYVQPSRGLVLPKRTRHLRHGYAACVSYIDAQIGRLLDELDTLQIDDLLIYEPADTKAKRARGSATVEVTRPKTFPHCIWAACDFEAQTPGYAWFGPTQTDDVPEYPGNKTAKGVATRPYKNFSGIMTGINPVPGPRMGTVNSLYLRYKLTGATVATFQHFGLSVNDNNHIPLSGLTEGKWSEVTMNFSRDGRRNDGTPGVPFKAGERMDDVKVFVGKPNQSLTTRL